MLSGTVGTAVFDGRYGDGAFKEVVDTLRSKGTRDSEIKTTHIPPQPVLQSTGGGKHCPWRVFVSGQHTAEMWAQVFDITRLRDVRSSSPPFNIAHETLVWKKTKCVSHVNVPVYGARIRHAIASLFKNGPLGMKELSAVSDTRITLDNVLDAFVQTKMGKVDCLIEQFPIMTDRLAAFVNDFRTLRDTDIKSVEDWNDFVARHVDDPDWKTRLHAETVLELFGIEPSLITKILTTRAGADKTVTMQDFAVTWISKALCAYGPKGCFADVANFIFAITSGDMPTKPTDVSETDVVERIGVFEYDLRNNERWDESGKWLKWIPDVLFVDLEQDDLMCIALARAINKNVRVVVQLPHDVPVGVVAFCRHMGWDLFLDKDSKNLSAIRSLFGYPVDSDDGVRKPRGGPLVSKDVNSTPMVSD